MQTSVQWLENVAFEAKSESGHSVVMDGSAEYGGENRGPRPMELILMGLGGCASFDIVTILKKSRQEVTHVECQLTAERADSIPAVFTKIHLHFAGPHLQYSCILQAHVMLSQKHNIEYFKKKNVTLIAHLNAEQYDERCWY